MTTSEINTLTQISEIEGTQILTVLSLSQSNTFVAGYLITGNRNNLVHIEVPLLWLYECQHYLSPVFTNRERCFDKIPIDYQDTIYHVDSIGRQTYSFAKEIRCDGNPATIIHLVSDRIEYFL